MTRTWLKRIAGGSAVFLLITAVVVVSQMRAAHLPSYAEARARWLPSEAQLLDRHGEPIHELRVDASGRRLEWTEIKDIAPVFLQSVVAAEDRRFQHHPGVDVLALAAVMKSVLTGEKPRGASTITMQTASLLLPELAKDRGRRSFSQKWRQWISALALERQWSKQEVLAAYVNLAGFRGELRGIAAASAGLCHKLPSGLDRDESVVLAALLADPNADQAELAARACRVAAALDQSILEAEIKAKVIEMTSQPPTMLARPALAPHLARRLLHASGEKKQTTLDLGIQRLAVGALSSQLSELAGRNVRDGAVLVVENVSGDILAYVAAGPGSSAPFVDGIAARRQAGSTLKPFLYALALEMRFLTAASVLEDSPLAISEGRGLYAPQDYDRDFKGPVSLRTALASSLNVPAVRTILLLGVDPFHSLLRRAGYLGLLDDPGHYGPALALGAAEVSLLEQVRAYHVLARGGLSGPLHLTGDEPGEPEEQLLSRETAYLIGDILSDRAGRGLTFGLANPLATRYWSAVKTGTSKDMRDNWCIGWSSRYTVGVWVGNAEGDAMRQVSGVTGAAPIWREVMDGLHATAESQPPTPPQGLTRREIRFEPSIEPARQEWFLAGTEQAVIRMSQPAETIPRIAEPADGTVIAIDPEIPFSQQAILFSARGNVVGQRWLLDGKALADNAEPRFWHPEPGSHELALATEHGAIVDRVRLEVRGNSEGYSDVAKRQ